VSLVSIGPLRMTPGSRGVVLVGLVAVLALVVLLAGLVLVLSRRLASAQRKS